MVQVKDPIKCFIVLTNTAREAIQQHFTDEHAFFRMQPYFAVYLEKLSIEETSLSLTIYFDNVRNKKLAEKMNERVVILDCVFDIKNGLVAKNFRTKGKNTPVKTNRRTQMNIHFAPSRINGHSYPEQFINTIAQLPVAQEKYEYVNKRIASWEGYLKVLYKNANIEDIDGEIHSIQYSPDFSSATIKLQGIDQKQWKQLKGLNLYAKGFQHEIGEVVKVNEKKQTVEVELNSKISNLAKQNIFDFSSPHITFSNASTKSQLNRLLKGFERLKEGLSVNPNLENFLFEDKPVVEKRNNHLQIDFHNNLNDYQKEAVRGALESEDLYVIQGPPGTGKTTVISEICFQNVKMGLKTLIASQSNLAVDNALDRLLLNKDIRILRYGRTDSIEEEGKKFIEENVAEHWKTQTYQSIRDEIAQHDQKEALLQEEIAQLKGQIDELQENTIALEQQIEQKKQAEEQLQHHFQKISELKKQIAAINKEREKTEKTIETLQTRADERKEQLNNLQSNKAYKEIQEKIEEARQNIKNNEKKIYYQQLQDKIAFTQAQLENLTNEIASQQTFDTQQQIDELNALKKLDEVKGFIENHHLNKDFLLEQLFMKMDNLYHQLMMLKPAKLLYERIEKAIAFNQKTFNIQVGDVQLPENHSYTISEVDQFLNKLALAFKQQKINPLNGIPSIRGLYLRRLYILQLLDQFNQCVTESKSTFEQIKETITKQLKQKETEEIEKLQALKEKKTEYEKAIQQYETELQQLQVDEKDLPSINELLGAIIELNEQIDSLTKELDKFQQNDDKINQLKDELDKIANELDYGKQRLQELTDEYKKLNKQGIETEKEVQRLQQITKQNPEAELTKTKEKIQLSHQQMEKLQKKIDRLPITKEIQKEWFSLLQQATDRDLDEIRKLYVKHANVIGTTCVASANKEFMDNFPDFDVVIIDEVSKATPPELLLPMLKGKKIILVGDHHQLPPLIGDDTFEETLEEVLKESESFEEKRELEKLLEESLFERLYKNLPNTHKTMLGIQYRMHENIMETIVPFYQHGKDTLHCGLENSDEARDHKLNGKLISRDNHLLWFDLPNESAFFEERMKEGASLFNASELDLIRHLLIDLNEACKKAKEQGLMEEEKLKSVGVISFYREQVNRINRLIEELHLEHLHLRTGSVDKFQGMEMDVILLSMVRNNNFGEIGFAKDYRRLNVALSRARELLVLIGSSEMFTKRAKQQKVREMYQRLFDIVHNQQGIRKNTIESLQVT